MDDTELQKGIARSITKIIPKFRRSSLTIIEKTKDMQVTKKKINESGFFFIGDGIIENQFHFLWLKESTFGSVSGIIIPETIVYHFNEPITWYFSSSGLVKKKMKSRLNSKEIKSQFLKKAPKCGVVATFIHKKQISSTEDHEYIFEYFDEERFVKFVEDKKIKKHGLLQRFPQPYGEYHHVIRATWSPYFCFYEKKVAKHYINDKKFDIYERCSTFDGKPYMPKSFGVNSCTIKSTIEKYITNIVSHVQSTSSDFFSINRIVLNFTVDDKSRLNLLFCSSIRCDNVEVDDKFKYRSPVDTLDYKLPNNVDPNQSYNVLKPKPLLLDQLCASCFKYKNNNEIYEVNYKTIINWAGKRQPPNVTRDSEINKQRMIGTENFNKLNLFDGEPLIKFCPEIIEDPTLGKVKNSSKRPGIVIPNMLIRIHPNLSEEDFASLIHDKHWLCNLVKICTDCTFELAEQSPFGGVYEDSNISAQIKFHGIGPKDPWKIKDRHEKTKQKIAFDEFINQKIHKVDDEFCCNGSRMAKENNPLNMMKKHSGNFITTSTKPNFSKQNVKKMDSFEYMGDQRENEISSLQDFSDDISLAEEVIGEECRDNGMLERAQQGLSQNDANSFFFDPIQIMHKKRDARRKKERLALFNKNAKQNDSKNQISISKYPNCDKTNSYTMGGATHKRVQSYKNKRGMTPSYTKASLG